MCGVIYTSDLRMITAEQARRFRSALDRILLEEERERHGIGMQKEKTVHAVLKYFENPDEDSHEIPIAGHIADIYDGHRVTEIQTANLGAIRDKLDTLLPLCPVRVVHPIPHRKWVSWIDPGTGEVGKKNRSPVVGSFFSAFRELYRISSYLEHPNLEIELLLLDLEEYRLQDGWGRDGKRGSHRFDRLPVSLEGQMLLTQPRDYLQFIPLDLEEPFTAAELAAAWKDRGRAASQAALVLRRLGVIEQVGKRGRSYLYRAAEWPEG